MFSGLLPGLVLFAIGSRIRRSVLQRAAVPIFVGSLVLLLAIFLPAFGVTHGRTRSWLQLGPVTFQPAELAKLGLILALAVFFTVRRPRWFDIHTWRRGLLPFAVMVGLPFVIIVLQPDVGTTVIIAAIAGAMYVAAGAPWGHLVAVMGAGVAGFAGLIAAAPYRLARLTVFLHPELDPQGIGYQVNQALLAIGSGGFFGVGLGHSRQKFSFLPEVIADSIFAVIAEEIGFVFSIAFLALYCFVLWRVFRNAMCATDACDRLILVGIGTWWSAQAIVNVGAMVGLLPLTGLPLPFVSYGGTAFAMALASAGIVMNLSRNAADDARR